MICIYSNFGCFRLRLVIITATKNCGIKMWNRSRDDSVQKFPQMQFVTIYVDESWGHEAITLHWMWRTQDMRWKTRSVISWNTKHVISDVWIIRMENVSCCVKCHHRLIIRTLSTSANNQFTCALLMTLNQGKSLNENSETKVFLLE